ncbi:MAG: TPM domain-containing protein [Myxococcaceae bacterium]|nr:TPM domain-containing protein [Myxococcaceae bacterium]
MFGPFSRRKLLHLIDTARVEAALKATELRTSGEVRVSVSRFFWGDVRRAAERAFERLGMTNTRERNGVLFFVVPSRHRFVVLGDSGIHEKVGDGFWRDIAQAMEAKFRAGDFTGGLEEGIRTVGEQLSVHFPRRPDDVNELPDTIDFGPGR